MTKFEKFLAAVFISFLLLIWFYPQLKGIYTELGKNEIQARAPEPLVYYEMVVEYTTCNDLHKDTVTINCYEKPEVMLKEGDLSYWNITGQTGGAVAGRSTIASYVRGYRILSHQRKTL